MHLAHNCTPVEITFDDLDRDYNICSKGKLSLITANPFSAIIAASNLAEKRKQIPMSIVELIEHFQEDEL